MCSARIHCAALNKSQELNLVKYQTITNPLTQILRLCYCRVVLHMPVRNFSSSTPKERILLVDDNSLGLSARKSVLEELGHRIATAASGADALEQFARQKFDLVVTDYKMPRMDGLELIARLRKQAPALPII